MNARGKGRLSVILGVMAVVGIVGVDADIAQEASWDRKSCQGLHRLDDVDEGSSDDKSLR